MDKDLVRRLRNAVEKAREHEASVLRDAVALKSNDAPRARVEEAFRIHDIARAERNMLERELKRLDAEWV